MGERASRHRVKSSRDITLACVFLTLTAMVVVAMAAIPGFFEWAFARHHNVLSWYVRPLFLVPFCWCAYRRSWAGIAVTLFLLSTSMFWFPAPAVSNPSVDAFLRAEIDYLTGPWTPWKVVSTVLVPLTLGLLGAALWRRNLWWGFTVLVLIAVLKILWSVIEAGSAGLATLVPALGGLAVCILVIWWGVRRHGD